MYVPIKLRSITSYSNQSTKSFLLAQMGVAKLGMPWNMAGKAERHLPMVLIPALVKWWSNLSWRNVHLGRIYYHFHLGISWITGGSWGLAVGLKPGIPIPVVSIGGSDPWCTSGVIPVAAELGSMGSHWHCGDNPASAQWCLLVYNPINPRSCVYKPT